MASAEMADNSEDRSDQEQGTTWMGYSNLGLMLLLAGVLSRVIRSARDVRIVIGGPGSVWDIDPSKVLMLAAFAVGLAYMLMRPKRRVMRYDLPLKILLLFIGYQFLSLSWGHSPREGLPWVIIFGYYVGIYMMVLLFTRRWEDLHRWGHAFMYLSYIVIGLLIYERMLLGMSRQYRPEGGGPTFVGIYARWMILVLPFMIHYAIWGRNRVEKGMGTLAVLCCVAAITLSTRRAPIVAFPFMAVAYLGLIGWRSRTYVGFLIFVILAMVVAVSLNPAHLKRLQTIVELEGTGILEEETLDNRFILYYAAIQATMEHWLVGLGPGGFMTWLRDEIGFGPNNPHNLTLLLTSEFGVVGLGIYGAFIWATYRRAREAIRLSLANNDIEGASYSAAAISSLVGLLIYAQFNPLFRASMIYIAAGLASVALYLARRHYGSGELDSAQPPAEVEGADEIERESAT